VSRLRPSLAIGGPNVTHLRYLIGDQRDSQIALRYPLQHAGNNSPALEGFSVVPHGAAVSRAAGDVRPCCARHDLLGAALQSGRVGGDRRSATERSGAKDRRLARPSAADVPTVPASAVIAMSHPSIWASKSPHWSEI
jgi:hypothetical protein